MSLEPIILKPTNPAIGTLSGVESVSPLGATADVSFVFNQAFPGSTERPFVCGEACAVEVSLHGEPVESAHLSLHFGHLWGKYSEARFYALLSQVYLSLEGIAFAVSDNSKFAP